MMELKDFVTRTLVDIMEGIKEAQAAAANVGAQVNVPLAGGNVREIEFDVEVTTSDNSQARGGLGVFVGAFGVGTQGTVEGRTSSAGRIRFKVPCTYPQLPR